MWYFTRLTKEGTGREQRKEGRGRKSPHPRMKELLYIYNVCIRSRPLWLRCSHNSQLIFIIIKWLSCSVPFFATSGTQTTSEVTALSSVVDDPWQSYELPWLLVIPLPPDVTSVAAANNISAVTGPQLRYHREKKSPNLLCTGGFICFLFLWFEYACGIFVV